MRRSRDGDGHWREFWRGGGGVYMVSYLSVVASRLLLACFSIRSYPWMLDLDKSEGSLELDLALLLFRRLCFRKRTFDCRRSRRTRFGT